MQKNTAGHKRRRSAPIASPLVPQRKRPTGTKAQAPAKPRGQTAISASEQDIVIDRLEKEIVPLLKQGSSTRDVVKRRLRMGINEVAKYLEAKAAASHTTKACSCTPGLDSVARRGVSIVLISRDVRPPRLLEHLHALVALTETPTLVLPGASGTLGRLFGFKTMAAFAICPSVCDASPTKTWAPTTGAAQPRGDTLGVPSLSAAESVSGKIRPATGTPLKNDNMTQQTSSPPSSLHDSKLLPNTEPTKRERSDGKDPSETKEFAHRERQAVPDVARPTEGIVSPAEATRPRKSSDHSTDDISGGPPSTAGTQEDKAKLSENSVVGDVEAVARKMVDEDVDSFVEFLRKKTIASSALK